MNRYDPIEYQKHSLLFVRPDIRMGCIDSKDCGVINSPSALVPDKQYSEPIERRETWFCTAEIRCYDGRDFVNTSAYAKEIWSVVAPATIAFSRTLWAVDLSQASPLA